MKFLVWVGSLILWLGVWWALVELFGFWIFVVVLGTFAFMSIL